MMYELIGLGVVSVAALLGCVAAVGMSSHATHARVENMLEVNEAEDIFSFASTARITSCAETPSIETTTCRSLC